jgi:hypothetical protein
VNAPTTTFDAFAISFTTGSSTAIQTVTGSDLSVTSSAAIPEPAMLPILCTGLSTLFAARRRR